ncbi:MAG: DUF2330 domain-containing protein [Armatimonadetes bacterium]|nr:DUF2330 domain-containing protein [Armatimonadota bacterium]
MALSAAQKAVVIVAPGWETLLLQTTYSGPPRAFAWVVPVPSPPPQGGVGVVGQDFVDGLFDITSPLVYTEVAESPSAGKKQAAGPPSAPPGYGSVRRSQVIVRQRLEIGPYSGAVLQATGPGVLPDWLRREGFNFPAEADPIVASYVSRGWYFVALRLSPSRWGSHGRSVTTADLPPLAIRFPLKGPAVYPLEISQASAPEYNVIDLVVLADEPMAPREIKLAQLPASAPRGRTIWALLCQTTRGSKAIMLSCLPMDGRKLPQESPPNLLIQDAWRQLRATRLWMRLRKERLQDLHFAPTKISRTSFKVLFHRKARARPLPGALARTARKVSRHWWQTGLLAFWIATAAVVGFLLGLAVARLFRKPPGAVTGLLLVMVVLAVAARLALAGFASGQTNSMYHSRASKFAKPIQEFFHDHGCYPASVEDLCGRAPTYGLDPSGNKVPLRGATARYYIGEIPLDPITRSRTTWRIDLASPELVTSTAFKTTVTLEGNVP